jgi:nuclear pore complex protein Nup85
LTGITGKFVNNELLSIHSFQPIISSSRDAPTKHANTLPVNVFQVAQSFILDDPIVRSLVSESSNIFYNLQTIKDKSNDIYLKTSRAYRSAIRTTLNKLQEAAGEDDAIPQDVRKYENFITIFYSIECLWHLCEFLLIDHSTMSVVPNLLEWVSTMICPRFTFSNHRSSLDEIPLSIIESKRS